jgi:hypothetical protein
LLERRHEHLGFADGAAVAVEAQQESSVVSGAFQTTPMPPSPILAIRR